MYDKETAGRFSDKKNITSTQWIILATVILASFLGRLDGTIVNLALPKIMLDFGINVSQASWISTAYIIASAYHVFYFLHGAYWRTFSRALVCVELFGV